ncbi:MAG TPA: 2-oxoacid:acceptor oxidoreductase family protein [Candidatus Hydrogenedens sp.]|nr:2-oxoacid:acceptor oxidoreductase family protein [Candidatus Hydrogenedens sp.]HOK08183.1 2-oxoacid:acceptor oxidoreductase family protein [Candidatus Hydrogenedens sp.]HOL20883.1 2-oxoacid:acceptor oxidoreductase family protein [Candidatus Hydrogenedens sp.]HPP58652.1 2-oxoacid:acceptor oxidoreductase family protein [Candidatus Hydrogenedens sp.]
MVEKKDVIDFFRNYNSDNLIQIRWHGRGGQGAVTAAKILAVAGYLAGYKGVTSAPFFGAERRGAPVIATTKLSEHTIHDFSQITNPDIVVVLDNTLLKSINVTQGLKEKGWLILNTPFFEEKSNFANYNIVMVNATKIAEEIGLVYAGIPLVNTPILGAVLHALPKIDMSNIHSALEQFFSSRAVAKNFDAISNVFKQCNVEKIV